MLTKKANTLCILRILRSYSDNDKILSMDEIINKMESDYGLQITRKTVYSCMMVLVELGYDISIYEDNGKGYYLDSREFDQPEVRLLMDCVYSNTAISEKQTKYLIDKLQTFLPEYKRRKYTHLSVTEGSRKSPNAEIFLNIEILDEAISYKKKVEFIYTQYNLKKELVPKNNHTYRVSPYAIIASNDGYYLFCNDEYHEDISVYRLDKIKNIRITEERIIPPPSGFSQRKYSDESVFMYSGERVRATFRCDNIILGHVIDKFGTAAELTDNNDGTFTATVTGAFDGLKIWALHYIYAAEVIEPANLRDSVIETIRHNKYSV